MIANRVEALRRRAGKVLASSLFHGLAAAGKLHPLAKPERHEVEVIRDVAYSDAPLAEHRLDIYRPREGSRHAQGGLLPIVLYVHGGAFQILSKDTHWIMGLAYARRGYLVFNIDYRLAPRHPYPAALADACTAYAWIAENALKYGGDLSRFVVAGESAGANLATSLALAACYERPEPFAKEVFATGLVPRAVLPACGMLQVTDPERFGRRRRLPRFVADRLEEVTHAYLRKADASLPGGTDLADPLLVLERGLAPARPLPPFFVPVGTKDPLLDDTRRLRAALDRLNTVCEDRYYPGEMHAFHALVFRPLARQCWAETFAFLDRHLA